MIGFKKLFLCLLIFYCRVVLVGASQPDNMNCVSEMEVPRYSWVARGGLRDVGTVNVSLLIGKNGGLDRVDTLGPDPRLEKEVEEFLRMYGKFQPICGGKRVHMVFTFRLEGEPRDYPYTRVVFKPPNQFIITSQRETSHQ